MKKLLVSFVMLAFTLTGIQFASLAKTSTPQKTPVVHQKIVKPQKKITKTSSLKKVKSTKKVVKTTPKVKK